MEVVPRAQRRVFSDADKRRILAAADRRTKPGEVSALLRREGVYSSSLSTWRRQREALELAAMAPNKRGRNGMGLQRDVLRVFVPPEAGSLPAFAGAGMPALVRPSVMLGLDRVFMKSIDADLKPVFLADLRWAF